MKKKRKVIAINEFSGKQTVFPSVEEAASFFGMTAMAIITAIKKGNLSTKASSYFDYLYEGDE